MVEIPWAPRIEGLRFRRFEGDKDYAVMHSIGKRSLEADKVDYFETAEDLANEYENNPDRDPHSEVIIAEVLGEPIAYGRISSEPGPEGGTVYWHVVHVVPERRSTGLRLSMFRFNESEIRSLAIGKEAQAPIVYKVWALDEPNDWREIVVGEGYAPSLHFFEMIRPDFSNIPDTPLPDGLELRPARPEDYLKIWNASKEAFRGKPWFVDASYDEKYYDAWRNATSFQPGLWKVAWDGNEVAGMARNEVSPELDRAFGTKRGHTQHLSVIPRWRKKGLGKALLAESLKMMRDLGLEEASLDVETQSTTGEVHLYESVGYQVRRKYAHYVKRVDPRSRV